MNGTRLHSSLPSVRAALWGVLGFVIFIEVSGIEQLHASCGDHLAHRYFPSRLHGKQPDAVSWTTPLRYGDAVPSSKEEGCLSCQDQTTTRVKSTTIVRVRSDWQLEQLNRTQTFELREFYWVVPSDFEVREGEPNIVLRPPIASRLG